MISPDINDFPFVLHEETCSTLRSLCVFKYTYKMEPMANMTLHMFLQGMSMAFCTKQKSDAAISDHVFLPPRTIISSFAIVAWRLIRLKRI